jgi:hypothetical protein
MKWILRALLGATVLMMLTAVTAEEMTRKQALCERKGIVTVYSLVHRDEYTEAEMLTLLQEDWEGSMSKLFGFASYVDMQRIIRDNYRKFGKTFKIANDEETIDTRMKREINDCIKYGF